MYANQIKVIKIKSLWFLRPIYSEFQRQGSTAAANIATALFCKKHWHERCLGISLLGLLGEK